MECLWKECVFLPKFLVCREEIKGSENFKLILSEKKSIPHENVAQVLHY